MIEWCVSPTLFTFRAHLWYSNVSDLDNLGVRGILDIPDILDIPGFVRVFL